MNTRSYRWQPGHRYRLRVFSPEVGRWRATIADATTSVDGEGEGEPLREPIHERVIRDLFVDADHLVRPMVWSEVFADCDHPSVTVRWSNLRAQLSGGGTVLARTVRTNYQTRADGGCDNTNSSVDLTSADPTSAERNHGFLQQTNTERVNRSGALLTLP